MIEIQGLRVRDGNEGDMGKILSLRKLVFGEDEVDKHEANYWRWEYLENPEGDSLIYVVEDKDNIAGHFADLPRRFSMGGEVVLGTLSVDLMVHPDQRRKGIFLKMGGYAVERVKEVNGAFMTAYPIRKKTIEGFKRIGWKEVAKLPVLAYPIRFHGIINRYVHVPALSLMAGGLVRFFYFLLFGARKRREGIKMEMEAISQFDEAFEGFWKKASPCYPIIGVRDREYLNWRYFQHPTRTYTIFRAKKNGEMAGYIVLRKVTFLKFNSAAVVDLLAMDEKTYFELIKKGIDYSRKAKVDLLGFMVPETHPYYRLLKRSGFLPSSKTFLFMVYPQRDDKNLLNPDGWYVTWGDTDVV